MCVLKHSQFHRSYSSHRSICAPELRRQCSSKVGFPSISLSRFAISLIKVIRYFSSPMCSKKVLRSAASIPKISIPINLTFFSPKKSTISSARLGSLYCHSSPLALFLSKRVVPRMILPFYPFFQTLACMY